MRHRKVHFNNNNFFNTTFTTNNNNMADEDFTKDNVNNGAFAEAGATEGNGTESEATKETADQGNISQKIIWFQHSLLLYINKIVNTTFTL